MAERRSKVLIVGGGPAGCAAATLLARWGHPVTLVTKSAGSLPDLGESVPPSTHKLFDVLGVRAAIDAAPFIRSTGNTVWWGHQTPRIETFAEGARGWQVTSGALAGILVQHVRQVGVDVQTRRAEPAETDRAGAAFVLDCTGRAGLLARARGLRVYDTRYRTVAMVGCWRHVQPFDLPDVSHTLIESYDGGWAWSVPRSMQERFIAVMVDPRTSEASLDWSGQKPPPTVRELTVAPSARGMKAGLEFYREQLGRTTHMARMIEDATLVAGVTGWDASMYHATTYVDGNILLVGDAGSFIDPLSSAGIKKALASGWLAAVAVNTSLRQPAMRDIALNFFAAREADVYLSFRALTERFFSQAAAAHAHPFWMDRGEDAPLPEDRRAIEEAHERLRTAPQLRVSRGPGVRVEQRPAVVGTEIVLENQLVTDDSAAGIRYAFDVDLLALIELAPTFSSVPELFEAYQNRLAPVTLPDFLGALATTLSRQWLVWL